MAQATEELLLLSGGIDSAAVAAWREPAGALWIDYGQRPSLGEQRAAAAVADALGIPFHSLRADASSIGLGLLHGDDGSGTRSLPSPEWWPYRNQLLVTIAAAWAWPRGFKTLLVGSVASDAERHVDGSREFYEALSALLNMQEGGLNVLVPAIEMSTLELVRTANLPWSVLGWTHSCHVDDLPCGRCPGCLKHELVLGSLDSES